MKSTVEEIRQRFDAEVERFSNLETGQSATVDAPLSLALVAEAAAAVTPHARQLLDVGCGAGNYSLKLLQQLPGLDVTLIDLSQQMLNKATERVGRATSGQVAALQGDIRQLDLGSEQYDIIVASAVLHHLRTDSEWQSVFASFYRALRTGGSLWINDLIENTIPVVQAQMWRRYGDYLAQFKGDDYRAAVLAYVEKEDTPKPLTFQLDLLRQVGFSTTDVLHKHLCFTAFGAVKG